MNKTVIDKNRPNEHTIMLIRFAKLWSKWIVSFLLIYTDLDDNSDKLWLLSLQQYFILWIYKEQQRLM